MKGTRHSEEQIITILKQGEARIILRAPSPRISRPLIRNGRQPDLRGEDRS